MRKALIKDGYVVNVIVWEEDSDWEVPEGHYLIDAGDASPGDTWDGEKFIKPTITLTWQELPQSMHVAALKSVGMVNGSPRATIYRMYLGVVYEIPNCRVSQIAYDNYVAGKVKVYNSSFGMNAEENKDSFVLIYFISENPFNEEMEIPVVVDKVIK